MSSESSPQGSPRSSRSRTPLSLDLSSLPPLTQPTPPTNTLLITNLQDPDIFRPDNLQTMRALVDGAAPIHSWAPLRSFRRIVVSFFDEAAAIRIRSILDGELVMGARARVYFGTPTPVDPRARDEKPLHLCLPDAGKLFFISPPPSPPHGWEVRREEAPNKQVHAEDLAEALARLHHHRHHRPADLPASPMSENGAGFGGSGSGRTRSSSSTMIYDPHEYGHSPNLPAIAVEDFTDSPDAVSPVEVEPRPLPAHTSRPPVELMQST